MAAFPSPRFTGRGKELIHLLVRIDAPEAFLRHPAVKLLAVDPAPFPVAAFDLGDDSRLELGRQRDKMDKLIGSIADLNRLPAALFIVDTVKEHIAVDEAIKLGIPTIAINDTNSDPSIIDFPIPANDDASKSIELIMNFMVKSIEEGLSERKVDKEMEREKEAAETEEAEERKTAVMAGDEESTDVVAPAKPAGKPATRARKTTPRK